VSETNPFGRPLDPEILREPVAPPARPLPAGLLLSLALPAASMALAALLQKVMETGEPRGDPAGRWLQMSSIAGLVLGLCLGLARGGTLPRKMLWTAWGAVAPLFFTGAMVLGVEAAHPFREMLAERGAANCRLTRKICSLSELREICTAGGSGPQTLERTKALLGAPAQTLCSGAGCTYRWTYAGPWTPDNWIAPGSVICSVVADAQGAGVRSALVPGNEVP